MKKIHPQKQRHTSMPFKKFISYVDSLLVNPEFQKKLNYLRRKKLDKNKNRIPEKLYRWNKKKHSDRSSKYFYLDFKDKNYEKKLIADYSLNIFEDSFRFVFLYNSVKMMSGYCHMEYADVVDLDEKLNHSVIEIENTTFLYDDDDILRDLRNSVKINPIAITINPYMSQRDIIDFIKKTYNSEIKPIQDKYKNNKINLGKTRRTSNSKEQRNNFIYKNRNKPIHELTTIINKEFPSSQIIYDYTYIHKLIRDELLKRGEK